MSKPSPEEQRAWDALDYSIRRERELSEELDNNLRQLNMTQPGDDGCFLSLLPLIAGLGLLLDKLF